MKFRKKHKEHSEVFTDSLNDILFILLMFFLITTTMANPNVKNVNTPRGTKDRRVKQSITISIDSDQRMYLGKKEFSTTMLDTILKQEVERLRLVSDTPTIVINADTSSYYGNFFKVLEAGKRNGARVTVNVK